MPRKHQQLDVWKNAIDLLVYRISATLPRLSALIRSLSEKGAQPR